MTLGLPSHIVLPWGPETPAPPAAVPTSGLAAPPRRPNLSHRVERLVLEQISQGILRPGDRLQEASLARALGVSPTPVREAIQRLVHDGVVVHRPRRGYFLAAMGPDEIEQIYTFRAMLEGLAAARAATRISPEDLRDLESLIEEGAQAAREGDPLRNAECNARFHSLILAAAQYPLVERAWRLLAPLRWLLAPAAVPAMSDSQIAGWVTRHRALLDALRSGDPSTAEAAARSHIVERMRRPYARSLVHRSQEKGSTQP